MSYDWTRNCVPKLRYQLPIPQRMAMIPGLYRQVTGLMAGHVMDSKFELIAI